MCGIVGYTGGHEASPILMAGLRRLEYRGYDSAGLATLDGSRMTVRKRAGRVAVLEEAVGSDPARGTCGISHTRWATHGPATDDNAHPHLGGERGEVAVVHNGVIENYAALRRELEAQGVAFRSQTDTEVVAHLVARELGDGDDLFSAVRRVLPKLEGTYGLAVVSPRCPGEIVGARLGSPLVVGLGEGEHLLASDPSAIAPHTARVAYLQDGEVVRLSPHDFEIRHRERGPITPRIDRIDWSPDRAELGEHAHYMLKEIREQPNTVRDACRGRLRRAEGTAHFGGLNLTTRQLRRVRRVVFAACGTSWHAALVGEYLIERLANLPVEVEYAGEFRYRNAPLDDRTLVFVLSQSGETADTLGALREAKRQGHPTLAICNVVGSTIAREADGGIYLHAGPEIGVASTKAFSAQVAVLTMLALQLGRLRSLSFPDGLAVVDALQSVPEAIERVLEIGAGDHRGGRAADRGAKRDVSRAGPPFPRRAGRGALAQGDQLSPRRRLPDGRDEARPARPDRPADAQHLRRAARVAARQDAREYRGSAGSPGAGDRRRDRGRRGPDAALGRLPADPGRARGRPAAAVGGAASIAIVSRRPLARAGYR